MDNESTKGIGDTSGFNDISQSQSGETKETANGNSDFAYIKPILDYLEKNIAFSSILISIIGYIAIASFGGMQSVGQYLGYLFFLFIMFVFYCSLSSNKRFIKIVGKNFFLLVSMFLFLIIIIQNKSIVMNLSVKMVDILKYK